MSATDLSSIFSFGASRMNLTPQDTGSQRSKKTQDLRRTYQQKVLDFGAAQSTWTTQESGLSNQCETMISQLRDTNTQLSADQNAKRTRHLQRLDSMIEKHQHAVMDLQSQISEAMSVVEPDEEDVLAIEHEIEAVKAAIESVQSAPPPGAPAFAASPEEFNQRIRSLEDRLQEMRHLLGEAEKNRERDSKEGTQKLQELVAKHQEAAQEADHQLQDQVDALNSLDQDHKLQVSRLRRDIAESKKQLARTLKSTTVKSESIQQQLSQMQRQHNAELKTAIEEASLLRHQLQAITNRENANLTESTAMAKRINDEKRKFATLHKELEMLKGELARATVEHETLMKELTKIDNYVLSQMGNDRF
jgi:chromosome segregation ATPase